MSPLVIFVATSVCIGLLLVLFFYKLVEMQTLSQLEFPIPVPVAPPHKWEQTEVLLSELGFRMQELLDESASSSWPSPTKIYTHAVFDAFAEVALLPTETFQVQFTSLFPEGSVRTIAGERRMTLPVLSSQDWVNWKTGSLASVWQEHMNRVAEHEKEYHTHPVAVTMESYHDFRNMVQSSIQKGGRQDTLIPETVTDHILVGFVFLNLGKKREALEMFQKASALDPRNAQLFWLAGRIALVIHDFKTAAKNFRESLLLRPEDRNTYFLMADALTYLKRKRQVYYVLKRAKEYFPDDPVISLRLGEAAVEVGELEDASRCLDEINNVGGASVQLFNALGKLHKKMGDVKKSEEYFRLARVFSRQKGGIKLPWEL